jgi:hypothetical protein
VSDLFVGETRFDGKGFKRIDYIDCHFHPSGAVNSLGYIFDLIDIRQKTEEPVVSLKARFLQAFSSLKLGGIGIDSALQIGFMLRALVRIPTRNLYAVTQHLLTRRNFIFLNSRQS